MAQQLVALGISVAGFWFAVQNWRVSRINAADVDTVRDVVLYYTILDCAMLDYAILDYTIL